MLAYAALILLRGGKYKLKSSIYIDSKLISMFLSI